VRVGIVDYLNSRPLAWAFRGGAESCGFEPCHLPPAEVAERLANGSLDIGLIPSIEVQRIPELQLLPGLCIAATHEVRSVLLVSKVPPGEIRRLALDENSRTSVALAKIVLSRRYHVDPLCLSQPPKIEEMMALADAALIIGDPALRVSASRYLVLDLAAEWRHLTGLPFVFAVWAVRHGIVSDGLITFFHHSLQQGLENLDALIAEAVDEVGLNSRELREYLTVNLSFRLGDEELAGLREFYRLAAEMELIAEDKPLRFLDACPSQADSVE
jgi:chorismate dehydratase